MSLADSWRLAVGTLSVWPVAAPRRVDRPTAAGAMLLAPLAVLPLGTGAAAVVEVGNRLSLPALLVGLLAVGLLALGTGMMHWDGLSDVADGLTASYDRERSLAVMKTGTSGPAGTVAVVVVLGIQAVGFAGLPPTLAGAVLGGVAVCAARVALVLCCARGIRSARPEGLGGGFAGSVPRTAVLLWAVVAAAVVAVAGHAAGLSWWRGPVAVGVAGVVVSTLLLRSLRRLGGVTGDVFGAAVELALAAMLAALA